MCDDSTLTANYGLPTTIQMGTLLVSCSKYNTHCEELSKIILLLEYIPEIQLIYVYTRYLQFKERYQFKFECPKSSLKSMVTNNNIWDFTFLIRRHFCKPIIPLSTRAFKCIQDVTYCRRTFIYYNMTYNIPTRIIIISHIMSDTHSVAHNIISDEFLFRKRVHGAGRRRSYSVLDEARNAPATLTTNETICILYTGQNVFYVIIHFLV